MSSSLRSTAAEESVSAPPASDIGEFRAGFSLRRLTPLLILAIGIGLFFGLGLHRHLSFEALQQNRAELVDFVSRAWLLAALIYFAVYAGSTVLSLPSCSLLTLAGGFLFGPVWGTVLSVLAATAGAFVLFTIAKGALGDPLRRRARRSLKAGALQRSLKAGALRRIETGFHENALSYLLFLRLVPIFPFFVVNLLPAFLGVRPRIYLLATLLGIIPGTLMYSLVGAGLGKVFESGEAFSLDSVLSIEILAGLAALAVLSMIPVLYKRWRKRAV